MKELPESAVFADEDGHQDGLTRTVARFADCQGVIYTPSHGDNAFTVPLFDDFPEAAAKQI